MKNLLCLILPICLLWACGDSQNKQESTGASDITKTESSTPANAEKVKYVDCTVYAASTDYFFEKENGERVQVRVENMPEERTVKIPDGLTDPNTVGIEGPPGPNPAMVGKEFLLIKDESRKVIEVKPGQ